LITHLLEYENALRDSGSTIKLLNIDKKRFEKRNAHNNQFETVEYNIGKIY
jgi:hypothetical protein